MRPAPVSQTKVNLPPSLRELSASPHDNFGFPQESHRRPQGSGDFAETVSHSGKNLLKNSARPLKTFCSRHSRLIPLRYKGKNTNGNLIWKCLASSKRCSSPASVTGLRASNRERPFGQLFTCLQTSAENQRGYPDALLVTLNMITCAPRRNCRAALSLNE